MRKYLALLGLLLLTSPAMADWTGKNAGGTTITFKNSGDCTSVVCVPIAEPVDSTGAAFGVTGNPFFIGFGSGVTLPAYASTPTFNLGTLNGAALDTSVGTSNTNLGAPGASACTTDTASCSLNQLLQRIAQRITSLITALGTPMQSSGGSVTANNSVNVTPTDCSGTITTGGTAQNAFSAQTTLHGFTIANVDPSTGSGEPLGISFTGTASIGAAGTYPLAAPTAVTYAGLSSFTTPPGFGTNHAVSIIGATTAHKFSCTWW